VINLIGRRFGVYRVLRRTTNGKYGQPRWVCRCKCGTIKVLLGTGLRTGASRRCICPNNVVGKRFHRWTVIRYIGRKNGLVRLYRCRCDCGTTRTLPANALSRSLYASKSCGCIQNYHPGESALNMLFASYQRSARKHDRSFSLSKAMFNEPGYSVAYKHGERELRWIFVPDTALVGQTTPFGSGDPVVIASRLARESRVGQEILKAGYREYGISRSEGQ
jgi:hypothetical protein